MVRSLIVAAIYVTILPYQLCALSLTLERGVPHRPESIPLPKATPLPVANPLQTQSENYEDKIKKRAAENVERAKRRPDLYGDDTLPRHKEEFSDHYATAMRDLRRRQSFVNARKFVASANYEICTDHVEPRDVFQFTRCLKFGVIRREASYGLDAGSLACEYHSTMCALENSESVRLYKLMYDKMKHLHDRASDGHSQPTCTHIMETVRPALRTCTANGRSPGGKLQPKTVQAT